MKTCFLFGHADAPDNIMPRLQAAVEKCYSLGISDFYVGNRGRFDSLAAAAVKQVKKSFPEIHLYLLIAYHPAERPQNPSEGFDGTYYPLTEKIPRPFAIVHANEEMLRQADYVICYVNHVGNTRRLLEMAQKRQLHQRITIENIAEIG